MKRTPHWGLISYTFLIAFFLMLLPLPNALNFFKPAWPLLVFFYWSLLWPAQLNVGSAWLIGFTIDILNGTLLGEHALAFTVAVYLVLSRYSQIRMSPILQQAMWVFATVLMYQAVLFCVQTLLNAPPVSLLYWLPTLTSMIIWPWVVSVIDHYRRKFKLI